MTYMLCTSCGYFVDASKGACSHCGAKLKVVETKPSDWKSMLKTAKAGSKVFFGNYQQGDGIKPIEWQVLKKEGSRLFLLCCYGMESRPYNVEQEDVTWENCTLRTWLNKDFYEHAFNEEEQELVVQTLVKAEKNPNYNTDAGSDTLDKVFILSSSEVHKYFHGHRAACSATPYAQRHGALEGKRGKCYWWLRTPGYYQYDSAYVDSEGNVHVFGDYVNYLDTVVRPAIWIDIKAL
jgi:hypothetical protein